MQYRLRTLLILLAVGPMVISGIVYVVATARFWSNYHSHENGPPVFHQSSF